LATIVNAGHINPLVYRAGQFHEAIASDDSGLPLGIVSGYDYKSVERAVDPGDNLLVFSDGVTDAMNPAGDMFDMDGVRRSLSNGDLPNRPTSIGERVIKSVKLHAAGRPQNDDIAFVCVGRLLENLPPKANDTGSMIQKVRTEASA
jgi:serine phosphatase RsbU (regulator of sigma subunit)